jgi:mediator of RNA polymerase II transcription subunit 16
MDANNNIEEPAMVDTGMMDPTMEDLFGDAGDGLNVGMAPAPLPASLILRVAEMQSRGCCA